MKATNSLTTQNKPQTFSKAITSDGLQNLIKKSVPDAASAARLTGTLISAVAASEQLQKCNPATVVAAALRGEGQGLTLGREYHLIPFGDKCAYVISYKGLIALALASGEVADMDCIEVREGEYTGRDRRTKRPSFDFSVYKTDEEAATHPVVGYYAYVETISGYFRFEYMSVADILAHAKRYSKSFDEEKYFKLQSGELTPQELEKIEASSPWYSATDLMMKKTVLRRLLNSGYVRLANSAVIREALAYDSAAEDGLIPDFSLSVDQSSGEVIEAEPTSVTDTPQEAEKAPAKPRKSRQTENTENTDAGDSAANIAADDSNESFFDD